jgi:uncharacterized protein (TIGR03118 family)
MRNWIPKLERFIQPKRTTQKHLARRPSVECLEDRCLLSASVAQNVLQTNLVSDLAGVAKFQDPSLVNPWGISESSGSPFWISDNNAGVSTLYNTQGVKQGLVVSMPTPGDPTGSSGTPTGTVFNIALGSGAFQVSNGTTSGPAIFLFATEDGTIVGWNPNVNPIGSDPAKAGTFGTIGMDNSGNNFTEPDPNKQTGAVYKGLTIATDPNTGQTFLYAANFRSGQVEVYDTNFKRVTTLPAGAFMDAHLPKGYAPFNVQELNGKIYVTYALQDATKHDDVAGHGHGFVDVFNLDGTPGLPEGKVRLISRGALDSPWGLAIAPKGFGNIGGDLLVGNFGNGRINVFDPTSGEFVTQLKDPDGEPIQIDGLWSLKVGNGGNGGDANTLYFTAGIDHEMHGLFGSLTAVKAGTPEGPAEAQNVQAALDVFQIDLTTVINDLTTGVSQATLDQAIRNLRQDFVALAKAEMQFATDAVADAHHSGKGETALSTSTAKFDKDALDDFFADLSKLSGDIG